MPLSACSARRIQGVVCQSYGQLEATGWRVELIYLALPSVEISRLRVAERVAHGGHDITRQAIERRFPRSIANLLDHFAPLVSRTRCFMNAGPQPVSIFEQQGNEIQVHKPDLLENMKKDAAP